MKPRTAGLQWLDDAFATPDPWSRPTEDCPDLDQLRATVAAELPLEERLRVLDHAARCSYCTESWRLALQLGVRPQMPFWIHFLAIFQRDLQLLAGFVGRLIADRRLSSKGTWLFPGVATAALACLALFVSRSELFLPDEPSESANRIGSVRRSSPQGSQITSLLPENGVLPRERFELVWSGPAGAVFDLRITTGDGELLHSARALQAARYRVPADVLLDLESGTVLEWRVSPVLRGGSPGAAKSFRVRLE